MADTSPHSFAASAATNQCNVCGKSLAGITEINGRCSPCFWQRARENKEISAVVNKDVDIINDLAAREKVLDAMKEGLLVKSLLEEITPLGGTKHDSEKIRVDLLPFEALEGIAEVLTHGGKKYGDHNWRKGFTWHRPYGAILRHLFAFWRGEDFDKDSGLSHLDHAGCELLFLISFFKTKVGVDDRPVVKFDAA